MSAVPIIQVDRPPSPAEAVLFAERLAANHANVEAAIASVDVPPGLDVKCVHQFDRKHPKPHRVWYIILCLLCLTACGPWDMEPCKNIAPLRVVNSSGSLVVCTNSCCVEAALYGGR